MSLKIIDPHTVHITATRADSLQQHLDEAVIKLVSAAAHPRAGILLTRHSATRYTAALDTDVPYGQTVERIH
ncbi:hypothetical protein [Arthrobacter sp.]|uniref:hypothetical protein n=1 Tax=Arthrobacter sp. TaxID=1667 RepID=UPI003391B335